MPQFKRGDKVAMKRPDARYEGVNPRKVFTVTEVTKGHAHEFLRFAEQRGIARADGFERD